MIDQETDARLTTKVASMNADQRWTSMQEIAHSPDFDSDESQLEFAKLLLGPDSSIPDEDIDFSDSPELTHLSPSAVRGPYLDSLQTLRKRPQEKRSERT
jgi:hypothetical protein